MLAKGVQVLGRRAASQIKSLRPTRGTKDPPAALLCLFPELCPGARQSCLRSGQRLERSEIRARLPVAPPPVWLVEGDGGLLLCPT